MIDLAEIRRAAGRTQVELATALNTSQAQISKIERQCDMLLSTLAPTSRRSARAPSLVVSARRPWRTTSPPSREGGDDDPDRDHPEEPPPRCPVLLGLADRRDHGQPHRQHRARGAALHPRIVIQIGAAAVPPIALLAAVHGIALAVRAGASGRVYRWAVSAVAAIGVGAFAVSFLALRDLMQAIGYSYATAWIFPAIIDTAVAVSTLMLVALGDKPARRARTATTSANTQTPAMQRLTRRATQRASAEVTAFARAAGAPTVQPERVQTSASAQHEPAQTLRVSAQTGAAQVDAEIAHVDASLASELIASRCDYPARRDCDRGAGSHRHGASINAAAKASGINYRTAQRIVEAAAERRQGQLVAAS